MLRKQVKAHKKHYFSIDLSIHSPIVWTKKQTKTTYEKAIGMQW